MHRNVNLPDPARPDAARWDSVRLHIEAVVAALIACVALAAQTTGIHTLLFPELCAMAYEVLMHPHGRWARSAPMLLVTPALTAVIGTLLASTLPLGGLALGLSLGSSLLVLVALRSAVTPAISAGLLPVALHLQTAWYPLGIACVMAALAGTVAMRAQLIARSGGGRVDVSAPRLHRWPPAATDWGWAVAYGLFVATMSAIALDFHLLVVPPLFVVAFELVLRTRRGHSFERRWAFVLAHVAVASLGVALVLALGIGPGSAVLSVIGAMALMRFWAIDLPPLLAIGLLPQLVAGQGWLYVAAVAVTSSVLMASFAMARRTLRSVS